MPEERGNAGSCHVSEVCRPVMKFLRSTMDHEKEILLAQAKKENPEKPDNIIEKMIIGRLNKEMKEICLLDQVYVQDSDLTVAKYVDKVAKENNANVTVTKFVRYETGEGIEKKEENFAEGSRKTDGKLIHDQIGNRSP